MRFVSLLLASDPERISAPSFSPKSRLILNSFCRGLAMEAMITLLTPAFIAYFLVLWIICKRSKPFDISDRS